MGADMTDSLVIKERIFTLREMIGGQTRLAADNIDLLNECNEPLLEIRGLWTCVGDINDKLSPAILDREVLRYAVRGDTMLFFLRGVDDAE